MMNSHSAPLIVTRNSSIVTLKVQNDSKQNEASCHDERPIPFSCPHCDKKFTKKGPLKVQNNNRQNEASPPKWSIISWWTPIQLLPLWQEIHQKRPPEGAKWQKNQPTWSYMKKSTSGITITAVPIVTTSVIMIPSDLCFWNQIKLLWPKLSARMMIHERIHHGDNPFRCS